MPDPSALEPPTLTRRFLASLNTGSLGVAIGFAFTAAVLFSPFFKTPFLVLLGRTLFLSLVLLLVFVAVQRVPDRRLPRWLPRWAASVLAVGLTAPLATYAVYVFSAGGNVMVLAESWPHLSGYLIIATTTLVLGLVITLTAQLRQREAQAKSLELQFELQKSELEKKALDARLALLQAQIEPHFLFNTLANVQALVEAGSPRAPEVLKSLIAYLRAAMPRLHQGQPTLADELELVRAYLALMQMRMPDRLSFAIDADASLLARPFPPMTLLTLAENAVQHGIDPSEDGGRIEVKVARDEAGRMHLSVTDTGIGMAESAAPGTGLTNLRERLRAMHGEGASLVLEDHLPSGLRAEIIVPG